MRIKKLLFVTKFDQLCFDALQSLLTLRQADLEHVIFVNVIERDEVSMYRGVGYKKDQVVRLRERANIRFIDWASNLFEQGMEVGVYITVGTLVHQVMDALQKESADLIVIGRPHAKGVLGHLYSGSDVTELLRRSSVPVLVYKHMSEDVNVPEEPFRRPLLAVDWFPASLRAVEVLKPLKNLIKEVNVMTVADMEELKGLSGMAIQKTRKEKGQKLREICDSLEGEGIPARYHVYVGDPAEEIQTAAHECRASVILTGSSTKSALVERWIGSIPRRIAEKSIYPIMVVPPQVSGGRS
jgi:nucleotide-binding universal stress UspA family protein